jgi:shikimate kinase
MKTNIALIGFMGAGKTAVGEVLAQRLGKEFVELDAVIEKRAGKSIANIFQQEGEIAFRELEIDITKEIAARKDQVIACGGGIILNKINIDRLKQGSVMVYLMASLEVIIQRTVDDKGVRPLLNVNDRKGEIVALLKFRRPLYENAADITIDTSNLSINAVVEKIEQELKRYEDFD